MAARFKMHKEAALIVGVVLLGSLFLSGCGGPWLAMGEAGVSQIEADAEKLSRLYGRVVEKLPSTMTVDAAAKILSPQRLADLIRQSGGPSFTLLEDCGRLGDVLRRAQQQPQRTPATEEEPLNLTPDQVKAIQEALPF